MCYRITSQPASAVCAAWPQHKRARYAKFEQEASRIAARHDVPIRSVADALLLFHDLKPLFDWSEAHDFMPMLCTTHGTAR